MSDSYQEEKPPQDSQRRLRRFFSSDPLAQAGDKITLDAEETHHLKHALRLGVNDECLVTDGMGHEALAVIESFVGNVRTHLKVISVRSAGQSTQNQLKIHVHQAFVKKIMDDLVDKAQELSVYALSPVHCKYCELKVASDRFGKVRQRWEKILKSGAKQSGTLFLTRIQEPSSFEKSLNEVQPGEAAVIFHPCEDAVSLKEWLDKKNEVQIPEKLHVWIGPEGGFTDREVEMARQKNIDIVHLGEQLLRVDTAFVTIIGTLKYGLKARVL